MSDLPLPDTVALIAGQGVYPRLLAESAKASGIRRLCLIAFRGETDPAIARLADDVHWLRLGQLDALLEALRASGSRHAVMAGQITPTALFRVRADRAMLDLLRRLPARNAETIFGAVADSMRNIGVELLPASSFMEPHMPTVGLLSRRPPDSREQNDIALGLEIARATSNLDIGQTVVLKEGTVLAVEAFEGTNRAIRRAGKLGGRGSVIVKVAKRGHDMRFDIPVVGEHTFRVLKRVKASALAVEAGRCILLEREKLVAWADRLNIAFVAVSHTLNPRDAVQQVMHVG
jgi:DUF1009 family protein